MLVYINEADMSACESFVTSYWNKEVQNSATFGDDDFAKRRLNIVSGKMGEFGAAAAISEIIGEGISEPDMRMWPRGYFQTEPDLTGHGLRYHVKTKLTFNGGMTWIAHKADPAVAAPQDNDVFVFAVADVEARLVDVRWIIPANMLTAKWGEPESARMAERGKRAIWECWLNHDRFDPYRVD